MDKYKSLMILERISLLFWFESGMFFVHSCFEYLALGRWYCFRRWSLARGRDLKVIPVLDL